MLFSIQFLRHLYCQNREVSEAGTCTERFPSPDLELKYQLMCRLKAATYHTGIEL